jgi:hypothetical protein
MSFHTRGVKAPETLRSAEFAIRRLRASDVELDYEAVMSSRRSLRVWSDSTWPADDFSLDDNRVDLAMHQGEHDDGVAFGYTVMAPDESRCYGSIYVQDAVELLDSYDRDDGAEVVIRGLDARVDFWLRDDLVARGMERVLLECLLGWFDTAWPLERVAFGSRRGMSARRRVYEQCGLEQVARLVASVTGREHMLHARP